LRVRLALFAVILRLADEGCGGGSSSTPDPPRPPVDASVDTDAGSKTCVTRADCDDGLFCTGVEECLDGRCVSARNAACRSSCADVSCDEAAGACVLVPKPCSEDVACTSDVACDDGRTCTDDVCIEGKCAHLPIDARCPAVSVCGVGVCIGDAVADPSGCTVKPDAAKCKSTEGCVESTCVPLKATCTTDRDCGDGNLCDGVERCVAGHCEHGARTTCVAGKCQHAECSNVGLGDPWCRIVGLARCP
jgi:hypothetical protein